jgi:two-component system nitrate/nitrite response regulator NarL
VSIVLADDHPLFREGVARTLAAEDDFDVVGEASDADEAVVMVKNLLPDIVILDISMPGSGIEAARQISRSCPVVKIIMLTVSEQDDDVVSALQVGARGYILKGIGGKELVRIVRTIHQGESYVSPDLAKRLLIAMRESDVAVEDSDTFSDLSAREEQILKGVARGLSNKEIGIELSLQEKTIKHYMTNILQKLHVKNRVQAALIAKEHFPS